MPLPRRTRASIACSGTLLPEHTIHILTVNEKLEINVHLDQMLSPIVWLVTKLLPSSTSANMAGPIQNSYVVNNEKWVDLRNCRIGTVAKLLNLRSTESEYHPWKAYADPERFFPRNFHEVELGGIEKLVRTPKNLPPTNRSLALNF